MIKGIIFDLDGTLLDSMDVWSKVDEQFLLKRNIPITRAYQEALLTMHFLEAAHYTINLYSLKETPEQVVEEWMNSAKQMYKNDVQLKQGAKKLLHDLKKKDIKLGIITSCHPSLYRPCIEKHGIIDCFDTIVEADTLNMSKSQPEIYHYLLEQWQLRPEECLFFDDVYSALLMAKNIGFHIVALKDEHSYDQRIENITEHIIEDFTQVGSIL